MKQNAVEILLMRGGTSKGVFMQGSDLPAAGRERDEMILRLLGEGDELQVDGLGGGNVSTSKLMAVWRSGSEGIDLEYLYAAVKPGGSRVDYGGNCGNLTAAVAMYGLLTNMISATGDMAEVSLLNLNTRKRIQAQQPLARGLPASEGDFRVAGVKWDGAKITTVHLDPGGAVLGAVLPTGRVVDEIAAGPGLPARVSIVDVTNPFVFVGADHFGLDGTELPGQLNTDSGLLEALEVLRGQCAELLGLVENGNDARTTTPGIPKLALVSKRRNHLANDGTLISTDDHDLIVRTVAGGRIHHACPVTGLMCTAAAGMLAGTVVHDLSGSFDGDRAVRIAHPKGIAEASAQVSIEGSEARVLSVSVSRTARPLARGIAYI